MECHAVYRYLAKHPFTLKNIAAAAPLFLPRAVAVIPSPRRGFAREQRPLRAVVTKMRASQHPTFPCYEGGIRERAEELTGQNVPPKIWALVRLGEASGGG